MGNVVSGEPIDQAPQIHPVTTHTPLIETTSSFTASSYTTSGFMLERLYASGGACAETDLFQETGEQAKRLEEEREKGCVVYTDHETSLRTSLIQ